MILVLVETEDDRLALISREALTFARRWEQDIEALVVGTPPAGAVEDCREQGVGVLHAALHGGLSAYAAAAWAAALADAVAQTPPRAVVAGGSPRGNEVLAHLGARLDLPMAANVVDLVQTEPGEVERQVVGGAALERCRLDPTTALLTVAGHAVEPVAAERPGPAEVHSFSPEITARDLRAQVVRTEEREAGAASGLVEARVVVGGGRGAGGPEGFVAVERLAERLGGAVGASRVVTSLGWRPHHEQVGQTGNRIAPDVYLACGISGAIQHWAGCASSKTIIAINTDADAPMVTKAHYAVIGDMHEILPAVLEELDRRG